MPEADAASTNRTGGTGRVVLAMATVLVLALIGAYLIVRADGSGEAAPSDAITVGTLTAAGLRTEVDGERLSDGTAITALHAGELITLRADVTTSGASSLWVRTFLDVAGIAPALAPHLSIYVGPVPTAADLSAASDITDPITFPGYVGTADRLTLFNEQPFVLDGTEETEAAGIATYPVAVAVYVDPATRQQVLARGLSLTAVVQSVPYRSHPDIPDGDQWVDGPHLALG